MRVFIYSTIDRRPIVLDYLAVDANEIPCFQVIEEIQYLVFQLVN